MDTPLAIGLLLVAGKEVSVGQLWEFFLLFLRQFTGGPGPMENNLVRFGLAAILWGLLLASAWSRQRAEPRSREKLLVWGFALGLTRELLMLVQASRRILAPSDSYSTFAVYQPVEHALEMGAIIVVAAAFLRFVLEDNELSRRFLAIGLSVTLISLLLSLWTWPRTIAANPEIVFHQTWQAWLFHLPLSAALAAAMFLLRKRRGWLRNTVAAALLLFFMGEFLILVNYATDITAGSTICPFTNGFHILAIPILGYVYLKEQAVEKKAAEESLVTYREHLEDLVTERTAELLTVNTQLMLEISVRKQAEEALEQLGRRNQLILESAGEGICGFDLQGRFTFVNPTAARLLGYTPDELLGRRCHPLWLESSSPGAAPDQDECPICAGYLRGIAHRGEDQLFKRKDHSSFPVRYVSSPTWTKDTLSGSVVVFQDITDIKRANQDIADRNARLSAQNKVSATLSRSLDLDIILETALDTVLSLLNMDVGLIFLLGLNKQRLNLRIKRGRVSSDRIDDSRTDSCHCQEISYQALAQLEPICIERADTGSESDHDLPVDDPFRSMVSTPLVSKGKALGVLTMGTQRAGSTETTELDLLAAIGQQIGMALENARLYSEAETWATELQRLHEASTLLASAADQDSIYSELVRQASTLAPCQAAAVIRLDQDSRMSEVVAHFGAGSIKSSWLPTIGDQADALLYFMDLSGPTCIENAESDDRVPRGWKDELSAKSILSLPIWIPEHPTEYLVLVDQQDARPWRRERIELQNSFMAVAEVALAKAALHRQLEWAAALEERQRIAAEMHDGLAQTLSLLGLRIDRAADLLAHGRRQDIQHLLSQIRETVSQSTVEVRRSIASLSEAPKPHRSLQQQLLDLVNEVSDRERQCIPTHVEDRLESPLLLPSDVETQVLPVAKEALLNAQRHAQASHISMILEKVGDSFCLSIADNGRGYDAASPARGKDGHFGLSIMRARAQRIGADLLIEAHPGQGTTVSLTWSQTDAPPAVLGGQMIPLRSDGSSIRKEPVA